MKCVCGLPNRCCVVRTNFEGAKKKRGWCHQFFVRLPRVTFRAPTAGTTTVGLVDLVRF
jgi:hypothetical protein